MTFLSKPAQSGQELLSKLIALPLSLLVIALPLTLLSNGIL